MRVKIRDLDDFKRTHSGIVDNENERVVEIYEVEAVVGFVKGIIFIVKTKNGLQPWPAEQLELIDRSVPSHWINLKIDRDLVNKNYGFKIRVRNYWGPQAYWDDKNRLFDIFD